eukprot:CAMPEP_0182428984 /NCGR_PEP_ID=MMETSP1167-20130531/25288_1 /TAXON_ID=2988 /ORGANISM="Mallomonas Sp, Strain CCMP3275" /LENGTH=289 /DNA_ID=CAMNT_0024612259 /DNA_START=28 /DNA_END=897 /DNA_ORIENTATION=+
MIFAITALAFVAVPTALSFGITGQSFHNPRSLLMLSDGRRALMGGNWKMNPLTLDKATSLASEVAKLTKDFGDVDVAIFPPSCFLTPVNAEIKSSSVNLGGQDCYFETDGAYTGGLSTAMLKDVGCSYILVGHSERRTVFGEDDSIINKKTLKVLGEGLKVVLCIGETKEEYEAGKNQEVCAVQLEKGLEGVSAEMMKDVVIAYEPVWAIGTGLVCPASVAQDVHAFIRSVLAKKYGDDVAKTVVIQYGGSVKPDNVKEIMGMKDIDGCLVGGASLVPDGFAKIVGYSA